MKRRTLATLLVAALVAGLGSMGGCSSPIPNRVPVGEVFPRVEAEPLGASSRDDRETIPDDFAGSPLLLLGVRRAPSSTSTAASSACSTPTWT